MPAVRQRFAFLLIVVFALILGGALLWNAYLRPYLIERAEAALQEALGSPQVGVVIHGGTDLQLTPAPAFVYHQVRLQRDAEAERPLARAERLRVELESGPLLQGEVALRAVTLEQAEMNLYVQADGGLAFDREADAERGTGFGPLQFRADDLLLRLHDRHGRLLLAARGCHAELAALQVDRAGAAQSRMATRTRFNGDLQCAELHNPRITATAVKARIQAQQGQYRIEFPQLNVRAMPAELTPQQRDDALSDAAAAGRGHGRLIMDLREQQPRYDIDYTLQDFALGPVLRGRWKAITVEGQADLELQLQLTGTDADQLKRTAQGHVLLEGRNLLLDGIDLDKWLADVKDSQRFGVVDIGALIFGGPIGLALTQAFDFAQLTQKAPGDSEVPHMVSEWRIQDGVAHARDVAFATARHRLALQGGIDLENETYQDLTVALIDARGCPIIKQELRGSVRDPQMDTANPIARLAAPAVQLMQEVKNSVSPDGCQVFYSGRIRAQ